MKQVGLSGLAIGLVLLTQISQAQGPIVSDNSLIAYEVVSPRGYAEGVDNGKTAYHRKKRGVFDSEPMYEVAYINKPSDLPPPTVIAPSPLPLVREYRAGKVLSKSDLKGEDAVFQRIFDDKEAEKCLWEPESCKLAKDAQQRRQFVVPKP